MPIITARVHRVRTVRHSCRLLEPNRDALVLYARFIGDTPDYVLNQLIDRTLARDRDFVAWRASDAAASRPVTSAASAPGGPSPAITSGE